MHRTRAFAVLAGLAGLLAGASPAPGSPGTWNQIVDEAEWTPRAGLQVLEHRDVLYLMGGRTPRPPSYPPIPGDSDIWGDVWQSRDLGSTWERILETDDDDHWPARAYFRALEKGGYMYVIGGQNFKVIPNPDCPPPYLDCFAYLPDSDFFNDVWRSRDGIRWTQMTGDAGWEPRAGLMAIVFRGEIFVMGGSQQDDPVFGGERIYFNDVWKSTDGHDWTQLTSDAPWAPRAGGALVVKNGYIYLLGGEAGFFCAPPPCEPPYFNDVWRTRDGENWELVTEAAAWSARPGHTCATAYNRIFCFGGFGLPTNPMDVWGSRNGSEWVQLSDSPWNAQTPDEIKYDFATITTSRRGRPSIMTFGGDRETFDFGDPENYLRIDNDVWNYEPAANWSEPVDDAQQTPATTPSDPRFAGSTGLELDAYPTPFSRSARLSYSLPQSGRVTLAVYDARGRLVREVHHGTYEPGRYEAEWNGTDTLGQTVADGTYFAALRFGNEVRAVKLVWIGGDR